MEHNRYTKNIIYLVKSHFFWIILIVFAGFTVRVFWWLYTDPIPVSDFEHYRFLAEQLTKYNQLGYPKPSAFRPPGYPIFLAVMMQISSSVKWLSFANIILSTILIYLIFWITILLTSKKTISLFAAFLCAFNPTFIYFSPILASEHLYILMLMFSFIMLIIRPAIHYTFFAGIIFGIAVLTRSESLFYLPVFMTVAFMTFKKYSHKYVKIILFLLAVFMMVIPWYVRNYYLVGHDSGLSTTGGLNFYYGHNKKAYGYHGLEGTSLEGLNEVERQKLGYKLGFEYISNVSLIRILKDVLLGSKRLYIDLGTYSLEWSISIPKQDPFTDFTLKRLKGFHLFSGLTRAYYILLLGSVLSCIFIRRFSIITWITLYGIIFMNWITFAWVFWGKPRYRYTAEVVFCILSSFILYEIITYTLSYLKNSKFRLEWYKEYYKVN